jgi:Tol biopolymer transport system component
MARASLRVLTVLAVLAGHASTTHAADNRAADPPDFRPVEENPKPRDPRELPSYMVPNIPESAEAYYGPDSKLLIAQSRDPRAAKTLRGTDGALTYLFNDDGTGIRPIGDRGQDGCSYIFPDGKRIAFTSTRDNLDKPVGNWSDENNYPVGAELYTANIDGTGVRRLTNNPWYDAEISVSPDGNWIVFGRQIDGRMDLWVMRSDGTGEKQITFTDDWQEGAPFFLPDNETITFRGWRRSEYGKLRPTPMTIFTIRRDGSDWRRHSYDRGMNWHPFPAPDGRHYVFIRAETPTDWEVYLGDFAGGEPKRLTYGGGFNGMAHFSPDGRKMNWSHSIGKGFMSNIRVFVMDVTSLGIGADKYVPFDRSWGQPMQDDPPAATPTASTAR